MAIKDPNVLDRINTLNTNLENANIAEIEKNISSRLFNVLDGANSISIDSELYASINDIASASDISTRIGGIHFDAVININGTDISNTGALPHGDADETQSSIDRITNTENDLATLNSNISNIRARFEENVQKLGNIRDEQNIFTGTVRNLPVITTDINNQQQLKTRVQSILRTLSEIINEQNGAARTGILNTLKTKFDGLDKTGITNPALLTITDVTDPAEITGKQGDYLTIIAGIDDGINRLSHERELRTHINGLKTTQIHMPGGFLPFGDAETVATPGGDAAATIGLIGNFNDRITRLNNFEAEIPNIRARYTENKNRLNRILQLQKLQERLNSAHSGLMAIRQSEFQAIQDISYSNLLLGPTIAGRPRPTATYAPTLPNTTVTIGGTTPTVVPLNFVHGTGLARPGRFDYTLCNTDGTPLRTNGGRFEYQNGTQTISIGGINFVNNNIANQTMTINNLQIVPIESVSFPLVLDLNVRVRIHDDATGLDIDHHKPIHLEITRPTLAQPRRLNAYDTFMPPMNDRIQAEYSNNHRENLENEAIWNILRERGNDAEINEIYNNETRRNLFINRIRRVLAGHIPFLDLAALQTGFRNDMTRMDRDVPVQYLLGETQFQDYVRLSIPDNLNNYAMQEITGIVRTHRDDILRTFLTFQTDIANNRLDNHDNLRALNQVPGDNEGPQGHPNSWRQRLRRVRSRKNNYTKFFQGRSAELNNQSLETEDGTVKYGVKVEVLGVNKIVATINIDGKDEPEIIEAANHDRLIRGILTRANTKDGESLNKKLLCNIALSVLKAMVMISPQRLSRQIPPTGLTNARGITVDCDRIEAFVRGGNLIIRGGAVSPITGLGGATPTGRVRQNVTIFNENEFKNLHDVEALESGIRQLSTQINSIMNATAQEYQDVTNGILNDRENRRLLRYNTLQWLRLGPVKRLRGRLAYGKTNNDFNFETSVNEAGKSVNIAFNGGKFTVSGTFDNQEYNYQAKDLGTILRKKINRKRVFDGVELAMVAAINEEYVSRLRTNNLVQTENFAVTDFNENKTGRVYIFDQYGDLSYLEIEDRGLNPIGGRNSGRIDPALIPVERIRCNAQERREFFQNPMLAGRLVREMRRRLALF